jgi:predicted RNase H-like HicB family nuclease
MSMKNNLVDKSKQGTAVSIQKRPEDYLKEPYARILIPESEGGFSAEVLEFPGCFAEGKTADEAFHNLEEAAKSWIEVAVGQQQDIPPPSANHGFAGKVALRISRDLHRLAVRKAQRDGISLNQCLVTAIAAWVGADNLVEHLARKLQMNFVQANFIYWQAPNETTTDDLNIDQFVRLMSEPKKVTHAGN